MALENILYDQSDPLTGRRTRFVQSEGRSFVVIDQDRRAILESNKIARSMFDKWDGYRQNVSSNGWTRVASIPLADFFAAYRRGVMVNPARFRAWLNTREARDFRTDDCRAL